jgi:hypothetical protein
MDPLHSLTIFDEVYVLWLGKFQSPGKSDHTLECGMLARLNSIGLFGIRLFPIALPASHGFRDNRHPITTMRLSS